MSIELSDEDLARLMAAIRALQRLHAFAEAGGRPLRDPADPAAATG
jgi:hypothetical protein